MNTFEICSDIGAQDGMLYWYWRYGSHFNENEFSTKEECLMNALEYLFNKLDNIESNLRKI